MQRKASKKGTDEYSFPPCKDPLSAKIILAFAFIWLIVGVFIIVLPFISTAVNNLSEINTTAYPNAYGLTNRNLIQVLGIPFYGTFILGGIGCFFVSAILFVVYNITCDVHRTEHHLQELIYYNVMNQKQSEKQMRYIDDTITRQSNTIIQIMKQKSSQDNYRTTRSYIPHNNPGE